VQLTFPLDIRHCDWIGILVEDKRKCDEKNCIIPAPGIQLADTLLEEMFREDLLWHGADKAGSRQHR
jgi:hypothetical protein